MRLSKQFRNLDLCFDETALRLRYLPTAFADAHAVATTGELLVGSFVATYIAYSSHAHLSFTTRLRLCFTPLTDYSDAPSLPSDNLFLKVTSADGNIALQCFY